jgi:SAM-dependent methyltransferase
MAGSGTILDMCRELKRQCISWDICPIRPDVERGDVRATNFPDAHFDFIFAHFPYWNMHTYSNVEGDLSHMPQDGFRQESRRVMAEACRILKPGKYYAVLIGDQRKDKQIIDWSAEFSLMGQSLFQLHDKIIWYAHGQRAYQGGYYDEWAACYNFCKQTFDTLLIFKKEPPHGHIQQ